MYEQEEKKNNCNRNDVCRAQQASFSLLLLCNSKSQVNEQTR